ncbi:hypothetical protein M513_12791 [Trichuris suis]|uniref:RRM domain-containing protein n=1 Tax=Trichuris suis TaxID=68888 RepID=A0A085LMZ4_9BILA|nr:hypothetical protein M513_12791 [Trichuris suis]
MTPLLDDVTAQYFLYSAFYGSCGCHCSSEEEVMEPTLMAMNFETINDMNRRYVVSLMNSCRLGENQYPSFRIKVSYDENLILMSIVNCINNGFIQTGTALEDSFGCQSITRRTTARSNHNNLDNDLMYSQTLGSNGQAVTVNKENSGIFYIGKGCYGVDIHAATMFSLKPAELIDINYWTRLNPRVTSRKVFIGGIPKKYSISNIKSVFTSFGPATISWPSEDAEAKKGPTKGFIFVIYKAADSVAHLLRECILTGSKYFFNLEVPGKAAALVQVRPWFLVDQLAVSKDFSRKVNFRRIAFFGGIPRSMKAIELAECIEEVIPGVTLVNIETDPHLDYPKGVAKVAFTDDKSFHKALKKRYLKVRYEDVVKVVEMKPFFLPDQYCNV